MNIFFSKYDDLNVKIDCDDRGYIKAVEDMLTKFVKGYRFMPRFKRGGWNGKISLFRRANRTIPYGLLFDIIKMTKKDYPDVKYGYSDELKEMFKGSGEIPVYDLAYQPYGYQKECVDVLLRASKGIVQVATAGGKSLIISYVIRNTDKHKTLIIVPTLQLVDQFKSDMIEYGIPGGDIGMLNGSVKETSRHIVVSTWQSLKNQKDILPSFGSVIVDECHTASADTITDILQHCTSAKYRIGVTGTMPMDPLDEMNVRSYIGPILKKFSGSDLADMGYVSKCTIKQLYIDYKSPIKGDYMDVRDDVFVNVYRTGLIKEIVSKSIGSILILVEKVEKEGALLEKILREEFPDKRIVFLSGKDKSIDRDRWRKEMNIQDNIVCIATFPIFQQGVNIPSLREIIFASPSKSYIRVIQSLGRILRKHVSKELGGATLWDICDNAKFLNDHASKRNRHYAKEGYIIEELKMKEIDGLYNLG